MASPTSGCSPGDLTDQSRYISLFLTLRLTSSLFGTCSYVTVDEDAERALFYAFAESVTNSREHPLVLWLNG